MVINPAFWKGKDVFLTGHTGYKGGWLSLWLNSMGANVHGYSMAPPTTPNLYTDANVKNALASEYISDIRDLQAMQNALLDTQPAIVIHMAAQAIVRDSYLDPVSTYTTNVIGSVNILEAIRNSSSVEAALIITSDKCYENKEWLWGYRENDPMGGHDPYSSSKACTEIISSAYSRSFLQEKNVSVATARAGNVIGGGDWAKDRLIPDAIRAFNKNNPLVIRNPEAIRPWQHVLEPLAGYIILCQQLVQKKELYAGAWNFGPHPDSNKSVSYIADTLVKEWGGTAAWKREHNTTLHEATILQLDCSKARHRLSWDQKMSLEKSLIKTADWYKAWNRHEDMHAFTIEQIGKYTKEHLSI